MGACRKGAGPGRRGREINAWQYLFLWRKTSKTKWKRSKGLNCTSTRLSNILSMPHHWINFSFCWESTLYDDDNISCHVMSCQTFRHKATTNSSSLCTLFHDSICLPNKKLENQDSEQLLRSWSWHFDPFCATNTWRMQALNIVCVLLKPLQARKDNLRENKIL